MFDDKPSVRPSAVSILQGPSIGLGRSHPASCLVRIALSRVHWHAEMDTALVVTRDAVLTLMDNNHNKYEGIFYWVRMPEIIYTAPVLLPAPDHHHEFRLLSLFTYIYSFMFLQYNFSSTQW